MADDFYKRPGFATLKSFWYAVLKHDGFQDIELSPNLPDIDCRNACVGDYEAVQAYQGDAESYLHTGKFESERQKSIWQLHVDGISVRKTAEILSLTRNQVFWDLKKIKQKLRNKTLP